LNKADLKVMREGLENGNPVLYFEEVAHAKRKRETEKESD
jgi:hypothetical protein